jgi:hypothetical protein
MCTREGARSGHELAVLHCSVKSFRSLGFLLWFVLGPGGLREAEAPGLPTEGPRGPPGGPRSSRGPGQKT